ncbi:NAD-dependent epimerase/dehydratase family protein [Granulicella mallensis]|uniref:NAD-dependent epimerase/dehydratase n=1 Tax=Granulicella mallensis (strain ATCC BAA-1857 / DSM 23137 / MP5ACTX8) TaxID=682795 RepID=G8NUV1_GRAMM|nr:NAD-dependent epimerase/dehydratase family protein [Granulicella mallensis]AEU37641.1 NAD-dependent epimerase/dehydratase [Granulicella mallensis MP5ACTX8]
MAPRPLPPEDLAHILKHAHESFTALQDARLFITGGTGFFGHWLLESLLHANRELSLNIRATVLTRNAASFQNKAPHIANDPAITLLEGDIRTFAFPAEPHTHILHAATDSGGQQASRPAYELAESILEGTRRVLQFAQETGATRLLYTSTGAVYGRSTTLQHTPETYTGAPDPLLLQSSYDEAKRMAEHLCVAYSHGTDLQAVIARCFAFVGPHLPLDQHFAIGNFLGAAIAGTPIHIKGDGTPRRSWLYMADLSLWLWTMLVRGQANRAYNVGSDKGHTIAEAARLTAALLRPGLPLQIDGTPNPAAPLNSYVPSIERARDELGLKVTIPLNEALRRTAAWHGYAVKDNI